MNFSKGQLGPDVSFYQDDDNTPRKIDFVKMAAAGAEFVVLRAGQNTWIDEDVKDYIRDVKTAGLTWGLYWFFDSRSSPTSQVNILQIVCGNDTPPVVIVDLEESYNGQYKGEKYYKEMLTLCKSRFPDSIIMIYTADWWWSRQSISDPSFFGGFPLWVAGYPGNGEPSSITLPFPWRNTQAHMWQFTDKGDGLKYGVESLNIDLNYWNLFFDFKTFWKVTGGTTPPTGGTMQGFKCIKAVNVRNASNVVVAALKVGDRIWGTKSLLNGLQRVTFDKIYRATGVVDVWTNCNAAFNDGSVIFLQSIPDLEPTPIPDPVVELPSPLWIGASPETIREYRKV